MELSSIPICIKSVHLTECNKIIALSSFNVARIQLLSLSESENFVEHGSIKWNVKAETMIRFFVLK